MCILYDWSVRLILSFFFFFFNDTATTEIYTLSLHDALPIYVKHALSASEYNTRRAECESGVGLLKRSEEHTSELQSPCNLVCRLLLEKKKKNDSQTTPALATDARSDVRSRPRASTILHSQHT